MNSCRLWRPAWATSPEIPQKIKYPEGPERHLDAARQKLPRARDNFCCSIAAQLPSPRGQFWKRKKCPLLRGRGNLGGILRDNLGEGNWESKIAARQWRVNFCREASRCLARPSGYPKSRSKVGFGGIQQIGQKVGPKVGFTLRLYSKTYFRTYFLTYFLNSPETYFWPTLLGYFIFSGISGLVAHAGRHNHQALSKG